MDHPQDDVLTLLGGGGPGLSYLPDLRLWYKWHRERGTLPAGWEEYSLAQVAVAFGAPAWDVVRPWAVETPGVEVETVEAGGERTIAYHTPAGTLHERWSLGPDGDWWQVEYPVKAADDLPAAMALVSARAYRLQPEQFSPPPAAGEVDRIVAVALPLQPFPDVLHTLLGWGDGLTLFVGEGRAEIGEMLAVLGEKLQALVEEAAGLPCPLVLAPDNLDGQYISPRTFRQQLASGYRRAAEALHAHGKRLVVHAGGPAGRLLPLLAEAGVDAVAGVSGPPQGDSPLPAARAQAGPGLVLWGGIPQDALLDTYSRSEFEATVREVAGQARADARVVLGVADHVPVEAELERLRELPALLGEYE